MKFSRLKRLENVWLLFLVYAALFAWLILQHLEAFELIAKIAFKR